MPLLWEDLDYEEQMEKILQAKFDPVFFAEDKYFLDSPIWSDLTKEILRRFIWGVPKTMTVDEWIGLRERALETNTIPQFEKEHVQWYNDLVVEAGMNSGKTFLASVIGLEQAFELISLDDPLAAMGAAPGTEFFILNVATSDEQAHDTVYAQEKGKIDNSPYFKYMNPISHYNEFRFPEKSTVIRCGGSNSGSLVGRAVKCALFDELDRFKNTSGERSGWAVYNGLGRGTKKIPALKARRVAISSLVDEKGIIDNLYEMSKRIDSMLGYKCATWEMNTHITQEMLADEFAKDPEAAARDYGSIAARDIKKYYTDPTIIKFSKRPSPVLVNGEIADWLIGSKKYEYVLTGDPAVKYDSFGFALGHLDDEERIIVDYLYKVKPKLEVDPSEVIYIVDVLLKRFEISKFIVDRWDYPETIKKIIDKGIPVEFNVCGLQQHERLKEAWRLGELDCFESEPLKDELENLELHGGRKVEHPRKGAKDLADALAQLVWELKGKPKVVTEFKPIYRRNIQITNVPFIGMWR